MSILLENLEQLKTTPLGVVRIKRNLDLECDDVVKWCKQQILTADKITKEGKNFYVYKDYVIITVNSYSYGIITAHKQKRGTS